PLNCGAEGGTDRLVSAHATGSSAPPNGEDGAILVPTAPSVKCSCHLHGPHSFLSGCRLAALFPIDEHWHETAREHRAEPTANQVVDRAVVRDIDGVVDAGVTEPLTDLQECPGCQAEGGGQQHSEHDVFSLAHALERNTETQAEQPR